MTRPWTAWVRVSALNLVSSRGRLRCSHRKRVFGCRSFGEGSGPKRSPARAPGGAEQETQRRRAGWICALSVRIK